MNQPEAQSDHPFAGLTPVTVIDAVESCGLICDARILALNSYENRVYQVGLEQGEPVIVKFYRPHRWSDAQIQEEHDFSLELADLEIPVVPPRRDSEGRTLQQYEGYRFAIFDRKGGRSPEPDDDATLRVLGRFLGRIHQVGALHNFQTRSTLGIEATAGQGAQWLLEKDFIPPDLREVYRALSRDLIERMQAIFRDTATPRLLRIHGDCHIGNVLWRDERPHFVDLDDTMTGPALQDLWMLLSGSRDRMMKQLEVLVSGYDEFFHFSPAELPLLESLRTMRVMHYSAWLARRWDDPAFPKSFPWFNTQRYWADHILELREQRAALDEAPLILY